MRNKGLFRKDETWNKQDHIVEYAADDCPAVAKQFLSSAQR